MKETKLSNIDLSKCKETEYKNPSPPPEFETPRTEYTNSEKLEKMRRKNTVLNEFIKRLNLEAEL